MVDWKDIHEDFSDKWHGNELKKSWQRQGFTPSTARPWIKAGFSPQVYNDVKKWIEIGFNSDQASWVVNWKEHGFAPQQAQEWIKEGLKIEDASLAHYLRQKNYSVIAIASNLVNWRQEYNQRWTAIHPDLAKKTYRQSWEEVGFTVQKAKEWIEVGGLDYRSASFAAHLRQESRTSQWYIEEQTNWNGKQVQKWLNTFVSFKKRSNIKSLDLSNFHLTGDLDLIGFANLKNVFISGNPQLGVIINKPTKAIVHEDAQQWLGRKYPKQEIVEKIQWERDKDSKISGKLTVAGYRKCREIEINGDLDKKGNLTSLKVINCPWLTKITCSYNQLTDFSVLLAESRAEQKLTVLDVSHNKFLPTDLTSLAPFSNLKRLVINNNSCFGSLAPLQNLKKLKELNISDTQIDNGLEYLPKSLQNFNCGGTKLVEELEKLGELKASSYIFLLKKWKKALIAREKAYDDLLARINETNYFTGLSYRVTRWIRRKGSWNWWFKRIAWN